MGPAKAARRATRSVAAEAKRVIPPDELRGLSVRSDLPGLIRLATHLAVMAATGALVWLALGTWWLLLPAMLLHGIVLVACFAPFHEGSHYTAFRSRRSEEHTSELQSLMRSSYAVFCWKKKNRNITRQ